MDVNNRSRNLGITLAMHTNDLRKTLNDYSGLALQESAPPILEKSTPDDLMKHYESEIKEGLSLIKTLTNDSEQCFLNIFSSLDETLRPAEIKVENLQSESEKLEEIPVHLLSALAPCSILK
jgi:hypothetical protein